MAINAGSTTYYQAKRGIVQDGLVLNLDAGVSQSYDGVGTTWYDLAGSNSGTLTNGPTFNRDNGGSISFDGSDDYVDVDSVASVIDTDIFTVQGWGYTTDSGITRFFAGSNISNNSPLAYLRTDSAGGTELGLRGSTPFVSVTGTIVDIDSWNFLAGVVSGLSSAKIYVNGVLSNTVTTTRNDGTIDTATIGALRRPSASYNHGKISSAQVYNRALTDEEILH